MWLAVKCEDLTTRSWRASRCVRANERSPSRRVANEERLEEATFVMTAMQANERTLSRHVANEGRLVEETTFLVDP